MSEQIFTTLLRHAKSTKGTFMFLEPGADDSEKTIRNMYIRRPVVDGEAPEFIRVTVESITEPELSAEEIQSLMTIPSPSY